MPTKRPAKKPTAKAKPAAKSKAKAKPAAKAKVKAKPAAKAQAKAKPSPAAGLPTWLAGHPGFHVTDVKAALNWYVSKMGCRIAHEVPGTPCPYGLVARGSVFIHFARQDAARPGFCYLHVNDADAIAAECRANGVTFLREIEDSDYGMRDFVVQDAFGNEVQIGHPLKMS